MKIFYIGFLPFGSTSLERCEAVAAMGHEVHPHDMMRRTEGANRVELSLMGRYQWGPRMDQANRVVLEDARTKDFDIVWVDKGTWLYPEVLSELRERSNRCLAIHYTPDSQVFDNRTRHYLKAIKTYDLHVTTKPFEVEPLRKLGAKDVLLVLQGYGAKFEQATPEMARAELASDVCFIGHCQSHYRQIAREVSKTDHDFRIWGQNWPRWARLSPALRKCVSGGPLWGDAYLSGLVSSKISLGLLSKYIPETTTTRTFEIPAAGTFLLAERTADHLALFEEGKEADFFGSTDELRDKISFYLRHDSLRVKIAQAGQARCRTSGYSTHDQLGRVLRAI
jgi:spore maturation protein CgeB